MKTKIFKRVIALTVAAVMLFACIPAALAAADLRGDIDGNGAVDVTDARIALRFAVDLDKPKGIQIYKADWDKDDKITVLDARRILRCAIGLEDVCDLDGNVVIDRPDSSDEFVNYIDPNDPYRTFSNAVPYDWFIWLNGKYTTEQDGHWHERWDNLEDVPSDVREVFTINPDTCTFVYLQNPNWIAPEIDYDHCPVCGKPTEVVIDGRRVSGCAGGGCTQFIRTMNCPYCGELVQQDTCHTCKTVINPHPFD